MNRTSAPSPVSALESAEALVHAPLSHRGKVREMFDLGDLFLMVVTDRVSAFDHVLRPAIPDKGRVLNSLSRFWFERTGGIVPHHVVHAEVDRISGVCRQTEPLRGRVMVVRKAERIDVECVVRGYLAGGGWRQYERTGRVNGIELPRGLRQNEELPEPIFTPAAKNEIGHDEDIPFAEMEERVGRELAARLREVSLELYAFARAFCASRGVILADTKFEFGWIDGELHAIDEQFTPDCSRFWPEDRYVLGENIDSFDKEPVRTHLAGTDWDRHSPPPPLPADVVAATTRRYREILTRITDRDLEEWIR